MFKRTPSRYRTSWKYRLKAARGKARPMVKSNCKKKMSGNQAAFQEICSR